jgi:hypothetical protein
MTKGNCRSGNSLEVISFPSGNARSDQQWQPFCDSDDHPLFCLAQLGTFVLRPYTIRQNSVFHRYSFINALRIFPCIDRHVLFLTFRQLHPGFQVAFLIAWLYFAFKAIL